MATTYQEYTGNGSTTTFSYTFPVLKTEDIKVALNGVTQTTGYTATTSPAQVGFSSAPASGVVVRVYRDTDVDSAKGVFAAGSSIRAVDLNNNQDQVLYALQEEQNQKGIFESISLDDSRSIKFGNSDDASIYWDGTGDELGHQLIISSGNPIQILTGNNKNVVFKEGNDISFTVGTAITAYVDVKPNADGTIDLGASNKEWKDLYVDGTGYIDTISADTATINGNLVVTGTISDSGGNLELDDDVNISGHIRLPDDKKLYLGNSDSFTIEYSTTSNSAELNSDLTIFKNKAGNATYLVVDNFVIQPYKNFIPNADDSLDLGASNYQWKDLYVDGTGYIDTVSADDITGSAIVTSGTSTSDTKVYSAKHSDALFLRQDTSELIKSGDTWSADDTHVASTAAIDARIVDLVDDVGGFVPIANETSFPNANPDVNNGAGTLISVPLVNNLTSNAAGIISINNGTVGNSTVTIVGAGVNTTYSAGFGIIVETLTTLNTYHFHRYVPKATEVTTVAANISNINAAASNQSNINSAVSNATNINAVATNISNVNTVAGISSDVTAVAGDAADIGACSTNIGSIAAIGSDLAGNFESITDHGSITGAVTSTGGSSSITIVANNINDIDTVSGISANVTTVAGISANVTSVAGNATNINSAVSNASNINTCATNISAITGASTQAANAASSATTATSQASTATTQASNASTNAANALAYKNLALTYRNEASAIFTQVESSAYNLADSASTHTAWGDITDTGANAVFANETSNILLTMAEGSSSYNYGSIT